MRVLMTTDTVGGVWVHALGLSRELCAMGVEVHLVTSGPEPSEAQRREAGGDRALELHVAPCRLEWMDDPWEDIEWWVGELHRIAREVRPDVVHANAYSAAAGGWDVPVLLAAHSCVVTWWRSVMRADPPGSYERYRRTVGSALERSQRVVAPTAAFGERFARVYRTPLAIDVIHNGGGEGFAPGRKKPLVLGAGRLWDQAKNIGALVEAAPSIDAPVVAVGDTGGRAEGGSVRWLGRIERDELRRHLAEASIFAHPARYEPFGLGVLEAAASGCALVLGDIPTLRELWDGAAEFVDPDNAHQLAETISDLLSDDERREGLAEAGRARSRCYSSRQMALRYLHEYESLRHVLPVAAAGAAHAVPSGDARPAGSAGWRP